MCRVPVRLRELVKQKLDAAAEEIFELLERTIAEYEEELASKYEELRRQGALCSPEREVSEVLQVKEELQEEVLPNDVFMSQSEEETAPPSESEELGPVSVKPKVLLDQTEDQAPVPDQDWTEPLDPLLPGDGPPLPLLRRKAPSLRKPPHLRRALMRNHFCPMCNRAFSANWLLERHLRVHTGERPFSCPLCGKTFSRRYNLQSHMELHKASENKRKTTPGGDSEELREKPFGCTVCGRRFLLRCHLRNHMAFHKTMENKKKTASDEPPGGDSEQLLQLPPPSSPSSSNQIEEKPYGCSVCGRRFSLVGNLKKHMNSHKTSENATELAHREPPGGDSELLPPPSSPGSSKEPPLKPYGCSVCGKRFSVMGYLHNHMTRHEAQGPDEEPAACPICGKTFRSGEELERHARVQHGERPFGCGVCGKRFSRKYNLQSHMVLHTGESSHRCSVCGKVLTTSQVLKRHEAWHRRNTEKQREKQREKQQERSGLIYCSFMD